MKIKLNTKLKVPGTPSVLAAPKRSKVVEWSFEGEHFDDEYACRSKALKYLKGIRANIVVEIFKHTYYRFSEAESFKKRIDCREYEREVIELSNQAGFRSLIKTINEN